MESERMSHSLSAQISYYNAKIKKTPDWLFAGVYVDNGISGTGTEKRDEFRSLIAECDAGKIYLVLTKSISRFARNTVDLLETVRHLKEIGVEVWFERENIHSIMICWKGLFTELCRSVGWICGIGNEPRSSEWRTAKIDTGD